MNYIYVMPFWSCRNEKTACTVRNWLTGEENTVDPDMIVFLNAIYSNSKKEQIISSKKYLSDALNKQIAFANRTLAENWYKRIENGWLYDFPIIDQIELTNRCPYSCKMRPRTTAMDRSLGNMSLDLFEQIIKQIADKQQYIGLHHFGESLIHPRLPNAVSIALGHGVQSGISCNPPSLTPKIGIRLLEAGIANIIFSFDSLDPKTYREIRGLAANFERGDANLREFIRLRDGGKYKTYTTLQMISMHGNQHETDCFLRYCKEVGIDRGVVIQLGRWDFDNDYVEQLGEFCNLGYKGYCKFPWNSVVVLWDGRVVPCCHDYNGMVVIGNLREQSIKEIWESTEAKKFRQDNYHSKLCRQCAYSRWYKEQQREQAGFRDFHKEQKKENREEWLNPNSFRHHEGRKLFDSFDILTS